MGMIRSGFWSLLPPPIWKAENEHGWHVFHWPSAAAIFIGWYLVSLIPSRPPKNITRAAAGSSTAIERVAVLRKASTCRLLRRCQAETASITRAPVTSEAMITCR